VRHVLNGAGETLSQNVEDLNETVSKLERTMQARAPGSR
jgi:hypothetical protein